MSRKPSNLPARLVGVATAAVMLAGILLVGFAVAEGRGSGARSIVCAVLGDAETGQGPGC